MTTNLQTTSIQNSVKPRKKSIMRRPVVAVLAAFMSISALGGCVTDNNQKQLVGSLIGAGLGGWGGSKVGGGKGQLAAVAVGALAGGLLGGSIGGSLDKADQAHVQKAQWDATSAPIGETISWSNPETGNAGRVTPTREGRHRSGAYCREYQTEVIVGGESQVGYGTACQMPDGDWKIQS